MTEIELRDRFALEALSKLLKREPFTYKPKSPLMQDTIYLALASSSYRIADAMMAARSTSKTPE